jgi:hypothetical protein
MHGAVVRGLLGRTVAAAFAAALVLSSSRIARADEPRPPEADTNPRTRPQSSAQVNLILVGAGVTAGWYGVAVGTSYLWPESDGASALRIPVAGPYLALAKTGCGENETFCDTITVVLRTIITTLSAVGQTGGVLVLGEGLFLPTAPAGHRRADSPPPQRLVRPNVTVTPSAVGPSGYGLSVFGNF